MQIQYMNKGKVTSPDHATRVVVVKDDGTATGYSLEEWQAIGEEILMQVRKLQAQQKGATLKEVVEEYHRGLIDSGKMQPDVKVVNVEVDSATNPKHATIYFSDGTIATMAIQKP